MNTNLIRLTLVALLLTACNSRRPEPMAATRLDYLGQTDGGRCGPDAPLQIERMTGGHYEFHIMYGDVGNDHANEVAPFATITLQERPHGETPAATNWSQARVPRDAEGDSFVVSVPVGFLPKENYQFVIAENKNGKDRHLGRFAFTLTEAGAEAHGHRPCGST